MHTYKIRKKMLNLTMVRMGMQQCLPDCKAVERVSGHGTLVDKIIGISKVTFKIKDDFKFRKIVFFPNNFVKVKMFEKSKNLKEKIRILENFHTSKIFLEIFEMAKLSKTKKSDFRICKCHCTKLKNFPVFEKINQNLTHLVKLHDSRDFPFGEARAD